MEKILVKYNLFLVLMIMMFMSCKKEDCTVNLKVKIKENHSELAMDSFKISIKSIKCYLVGGLDACINDTSFISGKDGLIEYTYDPCYSTEMVLDGFIKPKTYAKNYILDVSEVSNFDSLKTCNDDFKIKGGKDYDFTIIIKPTIAIKVQAQDTSFKTFDLPEYEMYNLPIHTQTNYLYNIVYIKSLIGKLNIILNKKDSTKVYISESYNAYKQSSIDIYHK